MSYKIHLVKAFTLVSIILLLGMFVFKAIIAHKRLEIFREYSHITLPPVYEIIRNTAGLGNNQTDVWLVFKFDKENMQDFLQQNKIFKTTADSTQAHPWFKENNIFVQKTRVDSLTTVLQRINLKKNTLEFRFIQRQGKRLKSKRTEF